MANNIQGKFLSYFYFCFLFKKYFFRRNNFSLLEDFLFVAFLTILGAISLIQEVMHSDILLKTNLLLNNIWQSLQHMPYFFILTIMIVLTTKCEIYLFSFFYPPRSTILSGLLVSSLQGLSIVLHLISFSSDRFLPSSNLLV